MICSSLTSGAGNCYNVICAKGAQPTWLRPSSLFRCAAAAAGVGGYCPVNGNQGAVAAAPLTRKRMGFLVVNSVPHTACGEIHPAHGTEAMDFAADDRLFLLMCFPVMAECGSLCISV